MKIYIHVDPDTFLNSYIVVNEKLNEAIIIDPGKITGKIISKIEENNRRLIGILVTHKHEAIERGITTLTSIYSPKIFLADTELRQERTVCINGDGSFKAAGFNITHINIPGFTPDTMMYRIGNAIFTGLALSAGIIGDTASSYAKHLLLKNIKEKILSQNDSTVLFPADGPPTSVEAEKDFNMSLKGMF